jgi:uncharacterized SAM-binding protein YcdF (DUF218 family)
VIGNGILHLASALGRPLRLQHPGAILDAVVVLGAPLGPGGALTAVLEERVRAGAGLWHAGAAPLVCVTGGGPPDRIEADAMAARLVALGVDPGAIRCERRARSTAENAARVAELLAPEGCRSVWLVTQPFHLRRAALLFARAGLEPRCHHIADSLQYRDGRRALRWIAREYAALGAAWLRGPRPRWPARPERPPGEPAGSPRRPG